VVSVNGQTVVEATSVSVVIKVVFDLAGQSVTDEGHAVMVEVRVVRTVEVVDCTEDGSETASVGWGPLINAVDDPS
jgi:hypothetical protein